MDHVAASSTRAGLHPGVCWYLLALLRVWVLGDLLSKLGQLLHGA